MSVVWCDDICVLSEVISIEVATTKLQLVLFFLFICIFIYLYLFSIHKLHPTIPVHASNAVRQNG